jgi:hypothetical protein
MRYARMKQGAAERHTGRYKSSVVCHWYTWFTHMHHECSLVEATSYHECYCPHKGMYICTPTPYKTLSMNMFIDKDAYSMTHDKAAKLHMNIARPKQIESNEKLSSTKWSNVCGNFTVYVHASVCTNATAQNAKCRLPRTSNTCIDHCVCIYTPIPQTYWDEIAHSRRAKKTRHHINNLYNCLWSSSLKHYIDICLCTNIRSRATSYNSR